MKVHEFTLILATDPNEEEAIRSAMSDVSSTGLGVTRVEIEPETVAHIHN